MTSDPLGPFGDLAAIGAVFARTRGALDTVLHRGGVDDEAGTVLGRCPAARRVARMGFPRHAPDR